MIYCRDIVVQMQPSRSKIVRMAYIRFPAVMKYYVDNQAEFFVPAASVNELIQKVVEQYPSLQFHLIDSDGNLRRHFNIFVNGTHIRELNGLETKLNHDDKVILMASAAGGGEFLY